MNALSLGLPFGISPPTSAPPPGTWILAANTWDDTGVWLDNETWND